MKVRAIIFDIYGTLLEVGLPPTDADLRWQCLIHDTLHIERRISRMDFSVAASKVITRHHEAARTRGIPWPEVHWPSVVAEVLPEFARLPPQEQEEFLDRQIQTLHATRMRIETADMLRWLREQAIALGIASNAQAYTLRELQEALATHELGLDLFERDLCFWSFQHGFSKPDPHVFRILTTRLEARGLRSREILMVGDSPDKDIEPARAHGWQTWQFGATAQGDWADLSNWLRYSLP